MLSLYENIMCKCYRNDDNILIYELYYRNRFYNYMITVEDDVTVLEDNSDMNINVRLVSEKFKVPKDDAGDKIWRNFCRNIYFRLIEII